MSDLFLAVDELRKLCQFKNRDLLRDLVSQPNRFEFEPEQQREVALHLIEECLDWTNLMALDTISTYFIEFEQTDYFWSRAFIDFFDHPHQFEVFNRVIDFDAFKGLRLVQREVRTKEILSDKAAWILENPSLIHHKLYQTKPFKELVCATHSMSQYIPRDSDGSPWKGFSDLGRFWNNVEMFQSFLPKEELLLLQNRLPEPETVDFVYNIFREIDRDSPGVNPKMDQLLSGWYAFCEGQELRKIAKDDPIEKRQPFKI